jgi:hypothetical protein
MEKGYFQPSLSIQDLEERIHQQEDIENIPLPNQLPARPNVPFETLKSATVQSLLEQNEDLSARLSVALKKQLFLENQNDNLEKANQKFNTQFAAFSDQVLVWREKERLWKTKYEALEVQFRELKARVPEITELEKSVERYSRYHEKVKTHIKPFIQGLKSYSERLAEDVRRLSAELERKEAREFDLEVEIAEQRQVHQLAMKSELQKQILIVQGYESSRDQLVERLNEQRRLFEENQVSVEEVRRLKILEDELTNRIVALERDRKEKIEALSAEAAQLRSQYKASLILADDRERRTREAEAETQQMKESLVLLRGELGDAHIQLSTQRQLWQEQAHLIERLRASNEALERINRQLSRNHSGAASQLEPAN